MAPGPDGLLPGASVFPLVWGWFLEERGATLLLFPFTSIPRGGCCSEGASSSNGNGFIGGPRFPLPLSAWPLGLGGCAGLGVWGSAVEERQPLSQEAPRLIHRLCTPAPPNLETKIHVPCISHCRSKGTRVYLGGVSRPPHFIQIRCRLLIK